MERQARSSADVLLPALLAALALALRLAPWRAWALNVDECFELFAAGQPTVAGFAAAVRAQGAQEAWLGFLVDFAAARLTRDILLLRLAPLAFGLWSVVLAYRLGRRAGGTLFGWCWGLLVSLSTYHVMASHTLRWYALAFCLTLLSFSAFLDALEGKGLRRYAAVMALYQLAYPYAFLVGLSQGLFALRMAAPERRRGALLALLPALAVFAVYAVPLMARLASAGAAGSRPDVPLREDLLRMGVEFSQGSRAALGLYLLLAAVGLAAGRRSGVAVLALLTAGVTLAGVAAAQALFRYRLYPFHAVAVLPLYLGAAAGGLTTCVRSLSSRTRASRGFITAVASLLVAALAWRPWASAVALSGKQTSRVRAAASRLRAELVPGDAVVFSNPNMGAALLYELDRAAFWRLAGLRFDGGFAVFTFPAALELASPRGAVPVRTLCRTDLAAATADASWLNARPRPPWLVHLPYNYVPLPVPFAELGLPDGALQEVEFGLFRLKPA